MRSIRECVAAVLLLLCPLAAFAGILPERQTWDFMQSVGGISIGDPFREDGMWYLPVLCDVSGTRKVTVGPTRMNSSLAAPDVRIQVKGSAVYVTVVTTMVSHNQSSLCKPASLGNLPAGTYSVFYRDPDGTRHKLGKVSIKQ